MALRRLLTLWGMLLLSGCLYHARERADQAVCDLVARPIDLEASGETEPGKTTPDEPLLPTDKGIHILPATPMDVQTAAWMQAEKEQPKVTDIKSRLKIPPEIPGSEAPLIKLPPDPMGKQKAIKELYWELPPLPSEPVPQPGPVGKPYTLATLQQIAAGISPQLRQAAADVETARGNLIQARAYPNPTVGYEVDPSNDGSAAGVQGIFIDQPIKTGGKLELQAAAAQKDLENAVLALKRVRSDLATQVRNAFFALVVAKETVRVNRALARFTDEVYRIQADLLASGFAAPYEPAALRAQAFSARLSLKQSIDNYIYSWEKLVATLGLKKLPLTEVAGRVDRMFPIYDYDKVLAHILSRHTDVLTARNTLDKARYHLKLAQIIPAFPDLDLRVAFLKEFVLPPKQFVYTLQLGLPLPIWDQNKGNIMAAEGGWVRASEEPHRVVVTLTSNLATAFISYRNNVDALEYYRKFILPDQVRTFRGVYDRRGIDPGVVFGDLVFAQQTLASNVATYLTILGQLWSSVVGVADLLQTEDLFQLGQVQEIPELPDLDHLLPWPCVHPCSSLKDGQSQHLEQETLPSPREIPPETLSSNATQTGSQAPAGMAHPPVKSGKIVEIPFPGSPWLPSGTPSDFAIGTVTKPDEGRQILPPPPGRN